MKTLRVFITTDFACFRRPETYFYKYKILRTSFEETDFSQTVSSAPLTSTLGDSNGDFECECNGPVVQNVDYILGNNPTLLLYSVAADVNADDQAINVLDIVGTVDIILNPLIMIMITLPVI